MRYLTMRGSRAAFTLLELLVVITIIGILAALTLAATFQFIDGQREHNTRATIKNVLPALEAQVQAVIAKAKKETPPAGVLLMAGNDMNRARVIWAKLKLKQEFPMTYAEALAPWSHNPILPPASSPTNPFVTPTDLPAKDVYKRALASVPGGGNEAMALLVLSLEVNRGGVTMATENLGSSAFLTNNTSGLRELIDGWRRPLEFFRFPTAHPDLDAKAPAAGRASKYRDPLDPDGTLMNPQWNKWLNYNPTVLTPLPPVFVFEKMCHTIHSGTMMADYAPRSVYMVPVIASAGRNTKLGLNSRDTNIYAHLDDMSVSPPANDSNDNIYSFQLK